MKVRRSPDVSWVLLERWNQLTQAQQDGFPPIVPDFASQRVVPKGIPQAYGGSQGAFYTVTFCESARVSLN